MKKDKNMFTIGEAAEAIGITRRIILNYESRGLIKPDIKEGASGNRYYTIDTLTMIRTVRIFQRLGLSLDEIHGYFCGSTDLTKLIIRLETMRDELNLNIEKLYERVNKTPGEIKTVTLDSRRVYLKKVRSASVAEKTKILRNTALEAIHLYGADTAKRLYFTEFDIDDPDAVSFGAAVPKESDGEFVVSFPKAEAVSTFFHGGYEKLSSVRERLIRYAGDNGIELTGKCRHIYIEGPPQHEDENQFITQIAMLIKK